MSEPTPRRRGRPRTHDPEAALRGVIPAFWAGGYEATSLDALAAAAGMNRPSLYAALGDKRAMYLAALRRMKRLVLAGAAQALDSHDDLAASLTAFFAATIDLYVGGAGAHQRGCLVVCTATPAAYDDPEIATVVREVVEAIEGLLSRRFRRARATNAGARAQLANAMVHSLAVRARAGVSKRELKRLAADTVALLVG
jgi:AcrR family transcriptional regulator